jgi:hypothetical protein
MFLRLFAKSMAVLAITSAPVMADWGASAVSLGADTPGATGTVDCAPGGVTGAVWGTGTYTSDSSICSAAVHFGWITQAEGGSVSFRHVAGLDSYEGSVQNGVNSSDYGSWTASFQVTGAAPLAGGPAPAVVDWGMTLDTSGLSVEPGTIHTVSCPPETGDFRTIWGTDVYTSDSPICVAAVHRGLINAASGGTVQFMALGAQAAYGASERNGVTSSDYPSWQRSYVFQ